VKPALFLLSLAALAQPFPKPDPQDFYRELKVFDAAGSPIRVPREDWAGARERIQNDRAWEAWLARFRTETEEWIAKRRDRVEWIAGWWHDFVSPRDGSFLTWTPDEPGEFTLSSPSDPRVQLTRKLHRAWVFGFRGRHADKVADAAALYRLTGEKRYAEWAASQLDFYSENYLKWPIQTEKTKARLAHQSLDEAVNLLRYVRAARWLEPYAAPERKQLWITKLFRPEAELLDETFQRIHNIACWQRSAQSAVALYAADEALWKRAVDGEFGIRNQIARGITSDYLWFEQSLGYNSYVVSALLPFFTEAAIAGHLDPLKEEAASVENLLLAPLALRFPTGKLPTPADTTGAMAYAPNRAALAAAYRVFPTSLGLAEAANQKNLSTLIDPPARAPAEEIPAVASRHLESSRMAVLRQGPWQIFYHYGQLDRSHAQAEALNFEAFFDTIDVSHDPGTVGYGSPLHGGYYTRGFAHNVPLVDRDGQQGWNPGEVRAWEPAKGRVAAAQPLYRKDASAEREIRVEGASLIDTVRVHCTGDTPRKIGLLLHLQGSVELTPAFHAAEGLPFWENSRSASFQDNVMLDVSIGGKPFQVTLAVKGPFTLLHGSTPDAPPNKRQTLYIETSGTTAVFTTKIAPR
jgi:hypothetical protein